MTKKGDKVIKRIISTAVAMALVLIILSSVILALFMTGYEIYKDVRYGSAENCVMDIYVPKKAYQRKHNGCVVFIHGGGWTGGDKSEEDLRCRNVANNGYIAINVNYTLYNEENKDYYTVNLVLNEIDSALGFAKDFCKSLGVTLTMAATSGYSAGGHLSMLYSYSRNENAPLEIKFTASMAGPADISIDVWGKGTAITIARMLSGVLVTDEDIESGCADEIFNSISPTHYVSETSPPSLFIYGGKDTLVTPKNAEALVEKFNTAGVKHDYFLLPDATHSLERNLNLRLAYSKRLIDYCNEYFK